MVTAAISVQPLLLSARWVGGSEPRLAAFAIVPALTLLAMLLARADECHGRRLDAIAAASCVATAPARLNPRYEAVAPAHPARQFAPVLAAVIARSRRVGRARAAHTPSELDGGGRPGAVAGDARRREVPSAAL